MKFTIEGVQIETSLRLALPEPQIVRGLSTITWHHYIVRNGKNFLTTCPRCLSGTFFEPLGVPIETHIVGNIKAWQLPRVLVIKPRVRGL